MQDGFFTNVLNIDIKYTVKRYKASHFEGMKFPRHTSCGCYFFCHFDEWNEEKFHRTCQFKHTKCAAGPEREGVFL